MQKPKQGYKLVKSLFGKYEEIPEEWEMESLGKLCQIRKRNGITSKLYVGLEHISQGTNQLVRRGNFSEFTSTKNVFKKGDVLYGKLRPLLNKVWLATEDGYCSTDVLPIISNEKLDNRILIKLLTAKNFVQYASSTSAGTKMPRTNWSDIKKYIIKLPPMYEQQKIASILSSVDDLINKYDKIITQTKNLKTGLIQTLFTKGIGHKKFKKVKWLFGKEIDIPEDWKVVELEQISKIIDSLHSTPKYSDSGISIIRSTEIKQGDLKLENALKVSKKVYNIFTKNYKPQRNDIVMSRVGTYFVTSFVNTDELFCMGQNTLVIHPLINSFFLYFALNSVFVNQQIEFLYDRTSGQKTLTLENIKKLKVTLPTSLEQEKISSLLRIMDFKIYDLYSKKSTLEKIKKGLMQKLLTGQIRVKF